jgi:hypothetical protein
MRADAKIGLNRFNCWLCSFSRLVPSRLFSYPISLYKIKDDEFASKKALKVSV